MRGSVRARGGGAYMHAHARARPGSSVLNRTDHTHGRARRYLPREWETIQRKLEHEQQEQLVSEASGETDAVPCTDVRFDGIGDLRLADDDLGPEETQLRVLGRLYTGCETLWYHRVNGEFSSARILHVQAVDGAGVYQDPTICKLSPKEMLAAEVDAHALFSRYVGESVPQRIGEPVYVDEVGGMVLELVGACWRLPELAHTQATLSNTLAEVCKYDSDHAAEIALPATARDRPVFGEVRTVIDEVFLGQLAVVVRQSAHRQAEVNLLEYYRLLPKIRKQLSRDPEVNREGLRSSLIPIIKSSTLTALRSLEALLNERGEPGWPLGPPGYPGPWFGIVHGDLHGGNIMVDSRSYAWLIDYGEVEDAHVFKDPAKLEACTWFIYTTLPIPPRALKTSSARELRRWLAVPTAVAEMIDERAKAHSGPLTLELLPELLRSACAAAGAVGKRVDVDEVLLRFAADVECDEYLREAEDMMDVLLPDRDLVEMAARMQSCPPFVTKERLRLCWDQVAQIRGLLPALYCRLSPNDSHPYDSHPIQYAVPLFYFALKMVTQYREPNPYSRRLAAHALERLSGYILQWLEGGDIDRPRLSDGGSLSLGYTHANGVARTHSFAYGVGQRMTYARGDAWVEATVLRSASASKPEHLLAVHQGATTSEVEVDLDAHAHRCIPLYAYAVGHPLRILSSRGAWEPSVVIDRAPMSNQFIVRTPPSCNLHWVLLLPWNHASMPMHARIPLFAARAYEPAHWRGSNAAATLDVATDATDADANADGPVPPAARASAATAPAAAAPPLLSTRSRMLQPGTGVDADDIEQDDWASQDGELDENVSPHVEIGRFVDFALNIGGGGRAYRSWRPLWCPGLVVGIHRKPMRSTSLSSGLITKTCDVIAGG